MRCRLCLTNNLSAALLFFLAVEPPQEGTSCPWYLSGISMHVGTWPLHMASCLSTTTSAGWPSVFLYFYLLLATNLDIAIVSFICRVQVLFACSKHWFCEVTKKGGNGIAYCVSVLEFSSFFLQKSKICLFFLWAPKRQIRTCENYWNFFMGWGKSRT